MATCPPRSVLRAEAPATVVCMGTTERILWPMVFKFFFSRRNL